MRIVDEFKIRTLTWFSNPVQQVPVAGKHRPGRFRETNHRGPRNFPCRGLVACFPVKLHFLPLAAVFAFAVPAAPGEPSFPPPIQVDDERAAALHRQNPDEFRSDPAVGAEIDFDDIDYDLLAAAVFHETNRRRAEHNLPALEYKRELREASRIQARGMKHEQGISHEHPKEDKQTVEDRLEHVGLNPRFFSENVAMVFGIRYESGEPFYIRREDGRRILSDEPGGPPIPPHTYQSFAEGLLESWMDSPGHRRNILATQPDSLGAECHHDRGEDGMDRFFCAQVFFAPLPDAPAANP